MKIGEATVDGGDNMKFLLFYENADGVGGDIVFFGMSYIELLEQLLEHLDVFVGYQMHDLKADNPDAYNWIKRMKKRKRISREELIGFDYWILGVDSRCVEIYEDEIGFKALLLYLWEAHFDKGDKTINMDTVQQCTELFGVGCLDELRMSYPDLEKMVKCISKVNEVIYCS